MPEELRPMGKRGQGKAGIAMLCRGAPAFCSAADRLLLCWRTLSITVTLRKLPLCCVTSSGQAELCQFLPWRILRVPPARCAA